ncbi:MAG: hypothetical protein AAGA93_04675 [Actinomycetota bacterium]
MSLPQADTRFDASPDDVLAAIAEHRDPVIVDLDETLLLANSTSLFLAAVRPAVLVYWLVKLVDVLRPRRRADGGGGSAADSDTRRVRAVLAVLPWSRRAWERRVPDVLERHLNRPLADALARTEAPVVISTKGFTPIVGPLVAGMRLRRAQLVSMDPRSDEDRDEAKLRLTEAALEPGALARSLVVTDSLADHRLLSACARPFRVLWPAEPAPVPFATTYVPGRYLAVKRPDANYSRKIIKEDLALWVLGSVWLADNPIAHTLGLVVLALSFWGVYEFGYMDNDRSAERYEQDPALSSVYHHRRLQIAAWKPVLFAVVAGVVGLVVLRWPEALAPVDLLRWGAVLAATVAVFMVYNRFDKQTRVLLYPLLQILRLGAFLAVVSTTAIADMALIIVVLIRWVAYYVYRTRDGRWPSDDLSIVQLLVFIAGSVLLASQHEWSDLWAPTTLSLLAWMLVLGRHALPAAVRSAHRIDRAKPSAVS